MITGRRFRLYPTSSQCKSLAKWMGCVRSLYNAKVEEQRYLAWLKRWSIFSPSWEGVCGDQKTGSVDKAYSHLKGDRTKPWMHEVPSQIYRNAITQWEQAWINHWKNPGHFRAPTHRHRGENDTLWLTRELFTIEERGRIRVGTKTRDLGLIAFRQHRAMGEPASVTITRDGAGRWWLSLCFEDGCEQKKPEVLLRELAALSQPEREALVVGHDRGIVRAVQTSEGTTFAFNEKKRRRMARWIRRIRTLNKKLARQQKGSGRRAKTRQKLARTHGRLADNRRDHAHQVSSRLVRTSGKVLVFEELNLRGMVRRPAPVGNKDGTHSPNGAKRKAGLNRSLHNAALGKILEFTRYKAQRTGKLVLEVPAHHSSQECSCCGHVSAANRLSQARFHCEACGHTQNADANASAVIRKRGITALEELLRAAGSAAVELPVEATRKGRRKPALQGANEAGIRSAHLAA